MQNKDKIIIHSPRKMYLIHSFYVFYVKHNPFISIEFFLKLRGQHFIELSRSKKG